jgi:hypothetical protein
MTGSNLRFSIRRKLPPRYKKATDLHSRVNRPIVSNALQLTVPYEDAVVLWLE